MMVHVGNVLFHYRNVLFPLLYLLLFVDGPAVIQDYRLAVAIGVSLAIFGQFIRALTIGLAYIIRGGKDRQVYARSLVQEGIFAHCRNPLYLGNFLILCGVAFASNSSWFMALGIPFFALCYAAIIAAEEHYLRGKFGSEYADYCARVNRFVPRVAGLTRRFQSMEFKWRRLLVKEYGSAYVWMAGMILVMLKHFWSKAGPMIWILEASFALLTVGYVSIRYLKKRGIVVAD
jgi:protein-S-isoprenylcysteine O-methyltransferase Ste14